MPTILTVRDKSTAGEPLHEFPLEVLTERVTVQEIIRSRVYQEVKDYNDKQPEYFRGLIQPTDAEKTLNGYKLRRARRIDWNAQYEAALEAFKNNRVIILVNDRQAEGLEQEVTVTPKTEVTFLKLVPLTGG